MKSRNIKTLLEISYIGLGFIIVARKSKTAAIYSLFTGTIIGFTIAIVNIRKE